MTDQEGPRKALNEIDGLRYRMGLEFRHYRGACHRPRGFCLIFASPAASDKQTVLLSRSCCGDDGLRRGVPAGPADLTG